MGQSTTSPHPQFSLIERIAAIIDSEEREITNRELLRLCSEARIGGLSNEPHLFHEIAETALNYLVTTKYGRQLLSSNNPCVACSEILKPLQRRLPTQSWRSDTQITYQQFSTPAPIAYLAACLLNLGIGDTVLEPSCGTGSLAVWASAAGATVAANEIDPRRRKLATLVGLHPTGHDAEFIDDLLPENILPNVVLANPPFSSSGDRTNRNKSKFGFRHVESALRRLEAGGKFAVILGESGSPRTVSGRSFWQSLLPHIRVASAIELPGSEYYRNGTTVPITLLIGRKFSINETESTTTINDHISISASSVEDAFDRALDNSLRFSTTTE